jgi:Protein of unknown function (DUF3126)
VDVAEVRKLDAYLKRVLGNPNLRVVPRANDTDAADINIADKSIGELFVDDEDDDRSYQFQMSISSGVAKDLTEIRKLDAYLKELFDNPKIRVVARPKKKDSAEVYIGEEFIGVLFVDDRAYQFQMAILEDDLMEQED